MTVWTIALTDGRAAQIDCGEVTIRGDGSLWALADTPTEQARSGGGWDLCPLVDRVENSQGLFERLGRYTSLRPERMVEPEDKE